MLLNSQKLYFKIDFKLCKILVFYIKNKKLLLLSEITEKQVIFYFLYMQKLGKINKIELTRQQKLLIYFKY